MLNAIAGYFDQMIAISNNMLHKTILHKKSFENNTQQLFFVDLLDKLAKCQIKLTVIR